MFLGSLVLACTLAGVGGLPMAVLHASTMEGTVVPIKGLDDLSATSDYQARHGSGKMMALLLGIGGLIGIGSGHHYIGAAGVASGVATAFIPGMTSSAFDNAPAATSLAIEHVVSGAWWAPLTAALYPLFLLLRLLQDPVVLMACVLALGMLRLARPAYH